MIYDRNQQNPDPSMTSTDKTILTPAERLKVLERLVTDDERELAAEIEKLRQPDNRRDADKPADRKD